MTAALQYAYNALSDVPVAWNATMQATAINAASNPYSMEVTPSSSRPVRVISRAMQLQMFNMLVLVAACVVLRSMELTLGIGVVVGIGAIALFRWVLAPNAPGQSAPRV
jgi:hypothetical protein